MKRFAAVLLPLGFLLLASPDPGEAQLRGGVHIVHAGKAFDGTAGLGLRGGLQLPVVPLDLLASGEYFFPDCPTGADGCGLRGLTVDGNFRMTLPMVRPYLSGGLALRQFDPGGGGDTTTQSGISLGAGVDVRLGTLGGFAEARWEFVDAPSSQAILRLGVLLGL